MKLSGRCQCGSFGAHGSVASFHDSHNFYVCAAAFGLLVGGYHRWAIGTRRVCEPQGRDEVSVEVKRSIASRAHSAAQQPAFGGRH